MAFVKIFVVWIGYSIFSHVTSQSRTNFKVTRFEVCKPNSSIKLIGNISTEAGRQYITVNLYVPMPLDENIGVTCDIYTLLTNHTAVPLFTVDERYLCKACNKYLGEFWYDLERGAQLREGTCPIRAGKYHLQHVYLDYRKITLQTFPFGKLRFVFSLFDNRHSKDLLLCLLIEVDNRFN